MACDQGIDGWHGHTRAQLAAGYITVKETHCARQLATAPADRPRRSCPAAGPALRRRRHRPAVLARSPLPEAMLIGLGATGAATTFFHKLIG
jgi:hypothetical protein